MIMRVPPRFFYEDWTGRESKRASQLLMQDAVIESYAVLLLLYVISAMLSVKKLE